MHGRVTSVNPGEVVVTTSDGVHVRVPGDAAGLGDLVTLSEGLAVTVAARNRSERPLDQQEWPELLVASRRLARRSQATRAVRQWFDGRGFLHVELPYLAATPGPAEGTPTPLTAVALQRALFLSRSALPHLVRLLAAGLPHAWTFAPSFSLNEFGTHAGYEDWTITWAHSEQDVTSAARDLQALVTCITGRSRPVSALTVQAALARWSRTAPARDQAIRLVEDVEPRLTELGRALLTDFEDGHQELFIDGRPVAVVRQLPRADAEPGLGGLANAALRAGVPVGSYVTLRFDALMGSPPLA